MVEEAGPTVESLSRWITQRTGLAFSPARRPAALRALNDAIRDAGGADVLQRRLETSTVALDELLAELTIGETYFFRQPAQFDLIRTRILPELQPRPERPLRLWSAGCATGEEAYTLAIVAREAGREATTVGTDISRPRLAIARHGRYGEWSLRSLPDETIDRYFTRSGRHFELFPHLRSTVEFRYLNLVEDKFPALSTGIWGMDLILCRNVLIYLDPESVLEVGRKMIASLSDQGWLLLGASDPMLSVSEDIEVVVTDAGLAYRRRQSGDGGRSADRRATVSGARATPAPIPPRPKPGTPAQREPEKSEEREARPASIGEAKPEIDTPATPTDDTELEAALIRIRELADRGKLAEAGRVCAEQLDRHRNSAELLYLHALLLLSGGRPGEAAEAARRALYLDREMIVAHLLLSDALDRIGQTAKAIRSLETAERLLREHPAERDVPFADGEPAGRLLRMAETRLNLLREDS